MTDRNDTYADDADAAGKQDEVSQDQDALRDQDLDQAAGGIRAWKTGDAGFLFSITGINHNGSYSPAYVHRRPARTGGMGIFLDVDGNRRRPNGARNHYGSYHARRPP